MLEGAIRLFGRFDDDVDGLLAPPEFAALYRFLEELESSDAGSGADWRVAFRRADLTSCGFIDLNALVLHMRRAGQLWVLRSTLTKDHSRTTLSASSSQQKPRLSADSVIRAAGDSAMLADEEYMERLIEQAQSAKGAGFVLDRLDDHRLLLRAVRLFGRSAHCQPNADGPALLRCSDGPDRIAYATGTTASDVGRSIYSMW